MFYVHVRLAVFGGPTASKQLEVFALADQTLYSYLLYASSVDPFADACSYSRFFHPTLFLGLSNTILVYYVEAYFS